MNNSSKIIRAKVLDIVNEEIKPAAIFIDKGKISKIESISEPFSEEPELFALPGFTDAHIHIESSMLLPSAFARCAVVHGTVSTVSDPHEIANVLGIEGVEYMIQNAEKTPFKFHFGAPSCVPATSFENAGAKIDAANVRQLLEKPEILYLSEMMNYPGVINKSEEVMAKIKAAHDLGKPVDGHAPGLRGKDLDTYIKAGISTDHECFTYEEAYEKAEKGLKILIREGSAAKNFEALIPLIKDFPEKIMFCSDDKHPDDLLVGHINELAARAVRLGYPLFDVLRAACLNPVYHYGLEVGLLREGDPADFILCKNLEDFKVEQTFINGECVAEKGRSLIPEVTEKPLNHFNTRVVSPDTFRFEAYARTSVRVIRALDGELITEHDRSELIPENGNLVSDTENDVLKIAVINRYDTDAKPSISFIKNFGLKQGAIASTVAHDSHNIIAVGVDDTSLSRAVNLLIEAKGGISAVSNGEEKILPLPVAGLMSLHSAETVGGLYGELDSMAKEMGSTLRAPYMTLSFMALLVIPSLKLSDLGLFDGNSFRFVSAKIDE